MKTLLIESGYTAQGIERFISVIESVLPHTPGNWAFVGTEEKLSFISKNKTTIESYINESRPAFTEEEQSLPFNFHDEKLAAKNIRYSELRSAEQTLRIF